MIVISSNSFDPQGISFQKLEFDASTPIHPTISVEMLHTNNQEKTLPCHQP